MIDISILARRNIRELVPYSSAGDAFREEDYIFLNANENSLGSVTGGDLNRYPDPHQREFKSKIATLESLPPERIFLGNGSDEAIDLLIRAFCEPGKDRVMILPPTYGMYEVCANINDVPVVKIPLDEEYDIDTEAALRDSQGLKLIFLCSPNNPTGNLLNRDKITMILSEFSGLVIVDEAYIDFAEGKNWLSELPHYRNLVILRTFSKAWGMANIRLGMAFADPDIIDLISRIKYPYNVNGLTLETAERALRNLQAKQAMIDAILKGREILQRELSQSPLVKKIFPSQANFLLVQFNRSEKVYDYLLQNRIIVRNFSTNPLTKDCLRITVGTPEENTKLLETLKQLENDK